MSLGSTLLFCLVFLITTGIRPEERVLLLVREGNNVNIGSVWNQTGVSYPTNLDPLLTVHDLIPLTLVRSPLIDDLLNAPNKIHIRTLNGQGDVLWEMVFQVPLVTWPTLQDFLVASNILWSSSLVTASTATISWSRSSYQLYIGSTIGTDVGWLGVWDGPIGQTLPQYPVFMIPRYPGEPPTMAEESPMNVALTYEGCWPFGAVTKIYAVEDFQYMTLEQCAFHCRALSYPRMFLEMGYKCHCGDFTSSPTGRDDTQCGLSCNGAPSNPDSCGGNSNMFATYPVPGTVSAQYVYEGCWGSGSLESQTYLDKPYMTVSLCNSVCSPRTKTLTVIQNGQSCQCGTFRSMNPADRDDSLCTTPCPGGITFEACGGGGKASVYLTDSGTVNQELPSTNLSSTTLSISVPPTSDILVNVAGMTGMTVSYVTSLRVSSISTPSGQYELYYNPEDCTPLQRKLYVDDPISLFSLSVVEELDTIPVCCMWISLQTPPGASQFDIEISFLNDTTYILATYLAIIGEWDNETTTAVMTSSVTPIVTSEVTTEEITEFMTSVTTGISTTAVDESADQTTTDAIQTTTDVIQTTTDVIQTTNDATNHVTTDHVSTSTSLFGYLTSTPSGLCPCQHYVTYTDEEIRRKIEYLQNLLTINKKTLSSYKRKQTSVVETRVSAISLGGLGILVIISSISLIVCSDVVNLHRHFRMKKKLAGVRDKAME